MLLPNSPGPYSGEDEGIPFGLRRVNARTLGLEQQSKEKNVLKKARSAGFLAATASALVLMGGTAYATCGHDDGHHGDRNEVNSWTTQEDNEWNGSVNVANDNNIQVPVGVCGNTINALIGINLPILSPTVVSNCSNATAIEND